jgi:hypothetical protein
MGFARGGSNPPLVNILFALFGPFFFGRGISFPEIELPLAVHRKVEGKSVS